MSIVHVPVSTAVKKYMLVEYQNFVVEENDRQIIQLHRKCFLGNFLASLMTDNLQHYRPTQRPDVYVTFRLARGFEKSYMTKKSMSKLSYHLEHLFKMEFCKFLGFYHSFGLSLTEAMDSFYDKYGLGEDDYSRDTMRRYYNRYGENGSERPESKKKNIFRSRPEKLDISNSTPRKNSTIRRVRADFEILQEMSLLSSNISELQKEYTANRRKSCA